MNSKLFFLVISLCTLHTAGKAQSFDCSSFCVQDIRFDTADPGILLATIYFSAEENSFINYPHVSAIVDHHGDTIATGTLNFFGQFGNTSQDYPLTPRIDTIPENLEAFLYFQYDTNTCVLTYPCMTSSTTDAQNGADINVYPNPFDSELFLASAEFFEDATVYVFNLAGQFVIKLDQIRGSIIRLDGSSLIPGMYYLRTTDVNGNTIVKKITKIH